MGTIRARQGKRGTTYRVRVEMRRDAATGERRWRTGTFATKKLAEAAERTWEGEAREGGVVASARPLGDYLAEWSAGAAVRESTRIRNNQDIAHRILPYLERTPLRDLDAPLIQRWVNTIAKTWAPGSVRRVYAVLHKALAQAVAWRLIPANPCAGIVLPRDPHTEMRVWDEGQVRRFLAVTADCPYAALWRLAVLVGLRKGELLALQWRDVDLARRTLTVRRTLTASRVVGWLALGPPKTKAGQRTISLPRIAAAALARQYRDLPRSPHPEAHVFAGTRRPWLDVHIPNRLLDDYTAQVNEEAHEAVLPRLRFHDLRHTAATLALLQGVSPRVVQERMGHASLAITLGLYSHVTLTMQSEAADRMDAMFVEAAEELDDAADD